VNCDIFIRSYWRDFAWLDYCLQSIRRYCKGFAEIVVVIPRGDEPWLRRWPGMLETARLEFCEEYHDDYLGQQVSKLHADQLSDAEMICHVDSDCIFRRSTTPDELAPFGKPRIFTRPVYDLPRHWPWLQPTEEFLGWRPTHDFLQCPPFTFPRWLYPCIRDLAVQSKGMSLADWVLSRPSRGFSEFNVLAAYAYAHHREQFVWTRAEDIGAEERVCRWYWSWGGLDAATRSEIEHLIGPTPEADHD
jgi:hypothetical protein